MLVVLECYCNSSSPSKLAFHLLHLLLTSICWSFCLYFSPCSLPPWQSRESWTLVVNGKLGRYLMKNRTFAYLYLQKLIRSCSTSTFAIDGGGNSSQTTFFVAKIRVGIVQQKSTLLHVFLLVWGFIWNLGQHDAPVDELLVGSFHEPCSCWWAWCTFSHRNVD